MIPEPADPHKWHAVGCYKACLILDLAELGVILALNHPMDTGNADIVVVPFGNPSIDRVERHVHIDGAYLYTENISTF
jgi:hypothetical protein